MLLRLENHLKVSIEKHPNMLKHSIRYVDLLRRVEASIP